MYWMSCICLLFGISFLGEHDNDHSTSHLIQLLIVLKLSNETLNYFLANNLSFFFFQAISNYSKAYSIKPLDPIVLSNKSGGLG